jgi:hypothetical protein
MLARQLGNHKQEKGNAFFFFFTEVTCVKTQMDHTLDQ